LEKVLRNWEKHRCHCLKGYVRRECIKELEKVGENMELGLLKGNIV
jgi:hypothetical protein